MKFVLIKEKNVSELLSNHDFKFQKKFGQNFLTDVKIPRRISMECTSFCFPNSPDELDQNQKADCLMLEIGPGAGILTKELAKRFRKVIAVEIDESLKGVLGESLFGFDNISIFWGDIMQTDLHTLLDQARKDQNGKVMPVSVCANLPYYITTPIIMKLLEEYSGFDYITVMVQKEVATRLCAAPGSSEYGAITAQINLYGTVKRLFAVPSGCFFPRPKVDSAVIRIELFKTPKYTNKEIQSASKIIKSAFAMRRKTLINALSGITGSELSKDELDKIIFETLGVSGTVRGEKLSSDDFVRLSKALHNYIK